MDVMTTTLPIRSYAQANDELTAAFERYLVARGNSPRTIRAYSLAVGGFVDWLGSRSVGEVERDTIRLWLTDLHKRGLDANTIRLRTAALRAFFKFIRLAGLTKYDPTSAISHRKIPRHVPRVLTVEEIGKLIDAARDPLERAVVEVLYATGVRVSELVKIRLEDIDFADGQLGSIRVHKGKGNKDRVVLFGRKAAEAIRDYLAWRPSQEFLLEAPARDGSVSLEGRHWHARFYAGARQREISVGSVADLPTLADARKQFERITANIPGFRPIPARPYSARAISNLIGRLGHRAKLGRVHPHALRRAFACHLLASGADLRVIQELLGHERVSTTALYTFLSVRDLKRAHETCHPHGGTDAKEKA